MRQNLKSLTRSRNSSTPWLISFQSCSQGIKCCHVALLGISHSCRRSPFFFFLITAGYHGTGKVKNKPVERRTFFIKTKQIQLENTYKCQQFADILGECTGQKINGIWRWRSCLFFFLHSNQFEHQCQSNLNQFAWGLMVRLFARLNHNQLDQTYKNVAKTWTLVWTFRFETYWFLGGETRAFICSSKTCITVCFHELFLDATTRWTFVLPPPLLLVKGVLPALVCWAISHTRIRAVLLEEEEVEEVGGKRRECPRNTTPPDMYGMD